MTARVDSAAHKHSLLVHLWLAPVQFYRRYLSPLKGRPTCRYLPTCSEYAIEAVQSRGVVIGTLKAVGRLLRCNPLFSGGYDPVCTNVSHRERSED